MHREHMLLFVHALLTGYLRQQTLLNIVNNYLNMITSDIFEIKFSTALEQLIIVDEYDRYVIERKIVAVVIVSA